MNALVARRVQAIFGVDVMHTEPAQDVLDAARRRWPGSGPVAIKKILERFTHAGRC